MSNSNTSTSRNIQVGPGLLGLCVLASITLAILKLTDVWAITWLVVLLPTLASLGLIIAIFAIFFLFLVILAVVKNI